MPYWIVIAWCDMSGIKLTGRYRDRLMQLQETVPAPKAFACTWRKGVDNTMHDLAKAEAYAKHNGYTVYRYDRNEVDPLGHAKREALAAFKET
jgi:hypothetical protein